MRIFVKPAHPLALILDPARGRALPPGGIAVERNAYWLRLLQRGDVVEIMPTPPPLDG